MDSCNNPRCSKMTKPEIEFTDTETESTWTQVAGYPPGILEKILSRGTKEDEYTRLLKFPPDSRTKDLLSHKFWEEVLILEGSIHDINKDKTFTAGYYACRPPGMAHGPYHSKSGCLLFEVRYYK